MCLFTFIIEYKYFYSFTRRIIITYGDEKKKKIKFDSLIYQYICSIVERQNSVDCFHSLIIMKHAVQNCRHSHHMIFFFFFSFFFIENIIIIFIIFIIKKILLFFVSSFSQVFFSHDTNFCRAKGNTSKRQRTNIETYSLCFS